MKSGLTREMLVYVYNNHLSLQETQRNKKPESSCSKATPPAFVLAFFGGGLAYGRTAPKSLFNKPTRQRRHQGELPLEGNPPLLTCQLVNLSTFPHLAQL